jgi:hypothetical protein
VVLLSNIEIKIYWIFLDQSRLTYKACMNNLAKINWYVQSSINLILKDKIDKKNTQFKKNQLSSSQQTRLMMQVMQVIKFNNFYTSKIIFHLTIRQ